MSERREKEGKQQGIPVLPRVKPAGNDGGSDNEKRGHMAQRPHVGIPLTPGRMSRTKDLAIEYWSHDMRGSPCLTATATFFRVRHLLHFMQSRNDFLRAVRKGGWVIRQRTSLIRKKPYTVAAFCNRLDRILNTQQARHDGEVPDFWVFTTRYPKDEGEGYEHHIHATNTHGGVVVDTAPINDEDTREVTEVWGVWA